MPKRRNQPEPTTEIPKASEPETPSAPSDPQTGNARSGTDPAPVEPDPVLVSEEAGEADVDLAALIAERDALKEQSLLTLAEFQNFRKRVQQEKAQLQQFGIEALVVDLLPVLDNFERTVAAVKSGAPAEAIAEGVQAVERQLRSVLEARKVKRIPSKGALFDPQLHDAVAREDSLWYEDGTVLEEIEPGYTLHERVIRPARVKVSRKP